MKEANDKVQVVWVTRMESGDLKVEERWADPAVKSSTASSQLISDHL